MTLALYMYPASISEAVCRYAEQLHDTKSSFVTL